MVLRTKKPGDTPGFSPDICVDTVARSELLLTSTLYESERPDMLLERSRDIRYPRKHPDLAFTRFRTLFPESLSIDDYRGRLHGPNPLYDPRQNPPFTYVPVYKVPCFRLARIILRIDQAYFHGCNPLCFAYQCYEAQERSTKIVSLPVTSKLALKFQRPARRSMMPDKNLSDNAIICQRVTGTSLPVFNLLDKPHHNAVLGNVDGLDSLSLIRRIP